MPARMLGYSLRTRARAHPAVYRNVECNNTAAAATVKLVIKDHKIKARHAQAINVFVQCGCRGSIELFTSLGNGKVNGVSG